MTRFLAIDWDDLECRYLLASVQKGSVAVQKVGAIPLERADDDDEPPSPVSHAVEMAALTNLLRETIKEERLGSCNVLLSLGRNKVETLFINLPPGTEQEVPAILKNQLLREQPSFSEFDISDHLRLFSTDPAERQYLAVAVPLIFRQSLCRSLRTLGLTASQIGLRSLCAAELVLRSQEHDQLSAPALVVNVVNVDVDFILVEERQVVSIRSFRLPEQLRTPEIHARIAEEIARAQIGGFDTRKTSVPFNTVYLFGTESEWTSLLDYETFSDVTIRIIHPFQTSGVTIPKSVTIPDPAGRFASHLGLLLGQAAHKQTAVDLLHPKEAPKAFSFVRAIILFLLFFMIAGYGFYRWNASVIAEMEAKVTELEQEYQETATQFGQVQPVYFVLSQTQAWDQQGIAWLEELRVLSVVLPGDNDIVVTQMTFTTGPINNDYRLTGLIQMSGMVREPSVLLTLKSQLEPHGYLMRYSPPTANPAGGGYPWLFRTDIYRTK